MKMITALLAVVLTFSMVLVGVTSSAAYDPWYDLDDDGDIDIFDIVKMAGAYGTSGIPINKTELLLELQARMDALNASVIDFAGQIAGCSGVVNIKDYSQNYGLTTSPASGTVTLDFDNPFNSTNYYLFIKTTLDQDFDPGSGMIPAGTVVFAQNVVKTVANFTAEVWYGEDLLKGAQVDLFYIAIEMGPSTAQHNHCASIDNLTVDSSSQVTITFSDVTFTNAAKIKLSASAIATTAVTGQGHPVRITAVAITTSDVTLTLECWNGSSYVAMAQDDIVQVSWTAVEQP